MNEPRSAIAELASFDLTAWHNVATGLGLMRLAMAGVLWGAGLLILAFILVGAFASWGLVFAVGAACYCGVILLFLVGLAYGCTAPGGSEARRYAQASLVLILTGLAVDALWFGARLFGAGVLPHNVLPHLALDWLGPLDDIPYVARIILSMLFVNGVLAIACWLWFLRAVAKAFAQTRIADSAQTVAGMVILFGSGWALIPWVFELELLLSCVGIPAVMAVPVSFIWAFTVLVDVHNEVRRMVRIPGQHPNHPE